MSNVKNLRVWQLGMQIVGGIHALAAKLPRTGMGGLKDQMIRAAISIPSNVAEGSCRGSDVEFRRFVGIALGSCRELETQLEIVRQLDVGDQVQCEQLVEQVDHEGRMLRRLMQAL